MRPTAVLWGQGSTRATSTRVPSKRRAMLRNMVSSLLEHERIETTLPKAKMAQPFAERMITLAKKGELLHKRKALAFVRGETLVHKLFHELAPRYAARPGGYTRVVRTRRRYGDNAQMAFLELVDGPHQPAISPLLDGMLPAADWQKLATIVEPQPGTITAQLENGVPMLLAPHSLGGMFNVSAIDSQKSLADELDEIQFSAELQELLPDDLEDMELADQEVAAKVLGEGGTVRVR